MTELEYNIVSKIVVIGEPGAGKTSLISKYTKGIFNQDYIKTVGAQFSKYDKLVGDRQEILFKLMFWDIAGQDQYSFMRPTFYNGAVGCIIVFDLTRSSTLDAVIKWHEDVKKYCGELPTILFGNKLDLVTNPVPYNKEKLDEILEQLKINNFYTTSAKTGINVIDAFDSLINILFEQKKKLEPIKKKSESVKKKSEPVKKKSEPVKKKSEPVKKK
jgi:small GTP-binding protein